MSVLRVENLSLRYGERAKPVLEIRERSFGPGICFLVGRNGSGKSTLLRALSGGSYNIKVGGQVSLNGQRYRRDGVGLVEQRPLESINPELSFRENLLLATLSGFDFLGLGPLATRGRVRRLEELLGRLGTKQLALALYSVEASALSAGQQQVLAILMRLVRNPNVLLLDECTASLDSENTRIIVSTLESIGSKGTVILFATHQSELLEEYDADVFELH